METEIMIDGLRADIAQREIDVRLRRLECFNRSKTAIVVAAAVMAAIMLILARAI